MLEHHHEIQLFLYTSINEEMDQMRKYFGLSLAASIENNSLIFCSLYLLFSLKSGSGVIQLLRILPT